MGQMVFKFGGASVKDAESILNVCNILKTFEDVKILVVVSAMGKTTNALEEIVNSYFYQKGNTQRLIEELKNNHYAIVESLNLKDKQRVKSEINDLFVEIDWIVEEEVQDEYDYIYDQIVSIGEMVSTKIITQTFIENFIDASWMDARDCIITDNTYRDARVDWAQTKSRVKKNVENQFISNNIIVTQGFIGSSTENFTTTLGREGSDYSAAIFSFCLDASSMHIWKDVPGVLTADPSIFENVTKINNLSYREAIEMTYYGAKVIHPKTIKPLQNKNIPLYVRPFGDLESLGTCISAEGEITYPPIIVLEADQALININTKDFSFVAEYHLSNIFLLLAKFRLKVNIMRNSAISFSVCVQNIPDKIDKLVDALSKDFNVDVIKDLELITIRHFNESIVLEMKKNKLVLFEENLGSTLQMVVKDNIIVKRKS